MEDTIRRGSEEENQSIDEGLGVVGAGQNIAKQENVCYFRGRGARALQRRLRAGEAAGIAGKTKRNISYLGGLQSATFTPGPELRKRLDAAKASHHSMGKFWFSISPFSVKRTM
eukprot:8512608-Pyramimonas_sp.AAC.1